MIGLVAACITITTSAVPAESSWYVDDDSCPGSGSGSIIDPFCALQSAIDAAGSGDLILAAAGTYHERINFIGKAVTLRGTAGPQATVIDGTGLGGTVVLCVSGEDLDTVLEGFTITGGAGAIEGGGMFNNESSPTVLDCTITGNSAMFLGGGLSGYASHAVVRDCRFIDNYAPYLGGGMANFQCSTSAINCLFSGNTVEGEGGGMYNEGESTPMISACVFSGNIAQRGAGMSTNTCSPLIRNSMFVSNAASIDGGGAAFFLSSTALQNCLFSGNSAGVRGGGLLVEGQLGLTITNCTWAHNSAPQGAGIAGHLDNLTTLSNCIVWGNTPDQVLDSEAMLTLRYCNVQGGWLGNGEHNMNSNPWWVDDDGADDIAGTMDDDLRLGAGSPCIDAGDNTVVEDCGLDLDQQERFVDQPDVADEGYGTPPLVDLGAYESGSGAVPDCNGNALADGCETGTGLAADCNANGVPDECEAPAPDLDGDGTVGAADLAWLLGTWGPCSGECCLADFDLDGHIGSADLAVLLGGWG